MDEDIYIWNALDDPQFAELFGKLTLCFFGLLVTIFVASLAMSALNKWRAK